VRIGFIVVIAAFAFAGGMALRSSHVSVMTTAPLAKPVDTDRAAPPVSLVGVDPGTLRPAAQRRRARAARAAAAPAVPPPPATTTAAPVPIPRPTAPPPAPAAGGAAPFDSADDSTPQANSFDSDR
jgi:hypothetical protein